MLPERTPPSHHHGLVGNSASLPRASEQHLLRSPSPGARLGKLPNPAGSSMERNVNDYSQTGLPSPYPNVPGDNQSEASSADHGSAAQYPNTQEGRPASYSTSATPTSEYGAYPQSARSTSSFPEHNLRPYHPASNHNGSSGGMAQQQSTSPSMPLQDGRNHQSQQDKSDSDVPIDPSIAAPSPTYPHGQYSPYPQPPQEMPHTYSQGGPPGLYAQPRPDWANYAAHPTSQMTHPHVAYPHPPTSSAPGRPPQVGDNKLARNNDVLFEIQCPTERDPMSPIQRLPRFTEPKLSHEQSPISSTVVFSYYINGMADDSNSMVCNRFIPLCRSRERSSTSDLVVDMKKSSECTSVAGTAVRRLTEH